MDDGFSRWLALREPVDVAARAGRLTRTLADVLPQQAALRILELGTGTGSNVRYLIDQLPPRQRWLLVDRDAGLLAEVAARIAGWAAARGYRNVRTETGLVVSGDRLDCRIETRQVDLAVLDARLFAAQDLVTGSALLDLVSERWLSALASACAASQAAVLFGLTYDGGSHCTPAEPGDARVRALMNQHQRGDKGFGLAVGPEGAERAARAFEQVGYAVRRAQSDWTIAPDRTELQARLLEGWHQAAVAMAPDEASQTNDWLARRLAHVSAGRSEIIVGHEDLAAWPGDNDKGSRLRVEDASARRAEAATRDRAEAGAR